MVNNKFYILVKKRSEKMISTSFLFTIFTFYVNIDINKE